MKKITKVAVAKLKFQKPFYLLNKEQKEEVLWEVKALELQKEEKKIVKYEVSLIDGSIHGSYTKTEIELIFKILFQSLRPYIGTGKRFKGLYYIKRDKQHGNRK